MGEKGEAELNPTKVSGEWVSFDHLLHGRATICLGEPERRQDKVTRGTGRKEPFIPPTSLINVVVSFSDATLM
jgi:hypothetical protein